MEIVCENRLHRKSRGRGTGWLRWGRDLGSQLGGTPKSAERLVENSMKPVEKASCLAVGAKEWAQARKAALGLKSDIDPLFRFPK